MGRSWYRPSRAAIIEVFGPAALVYDTASRFFYHPYWLGDSLYIQEFRLGAGRDTVYRRTERIDYIVGSGHQTRSYVLERNGYLYEAPITWYVQRQLWDLSPGYHGGQNSRFDRALGTECVHCHNGFSDPVPGTVNRFRRVALGIDCERCHGPGQEHVRRMEAGEEVDVSRDVDWSIVNPRKLDVDAQFDVCQQCHLSGVRVPLQPEQEFRPGMRLAGFLEIFQWQNEDARAFGISSHANRLKQSACFTQSSGRLVCTTCHDPHVNHTEQSRTWYNQQCQGCHTPQHENPAFRTVCTAPQAQRTARQDDCAACHMPKGGTSDIPHVAFSDHRIRVVDPTDTLPATLSPAQTAQQRFALELLCATNPAPTAPATGWAYLLWYEQLRPEAAVLQRAATHLPPNDAFAQARLAYYQNQLPQAVQHIRQAYRQQPHDLWRQYWQARILAENGQLAEAKSLYDTLYARHPSITEAADQAALLALQLRPGDPAALAEARRLLQTAVQTKPHDARLWCNLGFVLLNGPRPEAARPALERALALNPDYAQALANLLQLELRTAPPAERRARALVYLRRLETADPTWPQLPQLQAEVNR
jgi:Flp pilus assembly protein TadD